jgi:hypothetical protein
MFRRAEDAPAIWDGKAEGLRGWKHQLAESSDLKYLRKNLKIYNYFFNIV